MTEKIFFAYAPDGTGFYLNVDHVVMIEDSGDGLIVKLSNREEEEVDKETFKKILRLLGYEEVENDK